MVISERQTGLSLEAWGCLHLFCSLVILVILTLGVPIRGAISTVSLTHTKFLATVPSHSNLWSFLVSQVVCDLLWTLNTHLLPPQSWWHHASGTVLQWDNSTGFPLELLSCCYWPQAPSLKRFEGLGWHRGIAQVKVIGGFTNDAKERYGARIQTLAALSFVHLC